MELLVTITATIIMPHGSKRETDGGRGIVLPDGQLIKPFVVLELNEEKDLTYKETVALGCDIEERSCEYEGEY